VVKELETAATGPATTVVAPVQPSS